MNSVAREKFSSAALFHECWPHALSSTPFHTILQVAKRELALECDYRWELASQQRFRSLVLADPELSRHVSVPRTVPELSTRSVMTSEWVHGVPIDKVSQGGGGRGTEMVCTDLQAGGTALYQAECFMGGDM